MYEAAAVEASFRRPRERKAKTLLRGGATPRGLMPSQAKRKKCDWSNDVLVQLRGFSKALKAEITMQSHVKTL